MILHFATTFKYPKTILFLMVEFGKGGYFHPMDRGYTQSDHHDDHHHGFPRSDPSNTGDVGVSIGDLGMSLGLGPVPNVQAIQAKLRPGTKKLEFVFTGMGKGSGQGQTPEMYGKKQREALVELGKANKVDFTTHSTVGVYGLAGMDQQGNFSKASKNYSMQEVKRAIEFAADVGRGGPVVVHSGEFARPIVDAEWNVQKGDPFRNKFRMYEDEEGRTSFRVVDTRTGGVIQEARKNRKVSRPVWLQAEENDPAKGVKKGDYIDYWGKQVDPALRVPKYNEEKGAFYTTQMGWEDLERESREMTQRAREEFRRWDSLSEKEKQQSIWQERIAQVKERGLREEDIKVRPEEAYIIATLETNAANARGWALQYGGDFKQMVNRVEKLEKALEFYEKIEEAATPEEKWKLQKQVNESGLGEFVPPETKYPSAIIKEHLREAKHRLQHSQESSSSSMAQAEEAMETIRHVRSAEPYALEEAYDAYARGALNALRHTDKLQQQGELKKPLAIAIENLFPEHYGSHPDELIQLVKGSRERMKELLVEQGMAKKEAEERAKKHITATFDTGHLNMWRKYWHGDPKKPLEENDKEFDKWAVQKVKEMSRAGVIGHVHLDDNYGYHDDHLAPGEGNTPIKEMIKVLKEEGYKGELIVEPGADYTTDVTGFHSVMKTWRHFGSPMYGMGPSLAPRKRTWGDGGYGFFGQNEPPYFVFGAYSPSEDWTLWSGVPLE